MIDIEPYSKQQTYSISVILPLYNEESNIRNVIENSVDFLQTQEIFKEYELIAIDDGSRDNTDITLRRLVYDIPYLKIITHSKNLGYGRAIMSGVKVSQYPLLLFMDADGQFDISEIKKVVFYLRDFDVFIGYRYKRRDSFYRMILGKIYGWLVFLLFGLAIRDINCGFKVFRREILRSEDIQCRDGVFYTEILLKAKNNGYKIKEIPVEHFPRLNGTATGTSLKVISNSIIDLIKLKYSLRKFQKSWEANRKTKISVGMNP